MDISGSNVTDHGVKIFIEFCRSILCLNLSGCDNISTESIKIAKDAINAGYLSKDLVIVYLKQRIFPYKINDVSQLDIEEDLFAIAYDHDVHDEDDYDDYGYGDSFLEADDPMEEQEREWMS